MKSVINTLLVFAVIVPIILLLWPFAMWNDVMQLLLRVIPAFAVQVLMFKNGKWNIVKWFPFMLTSVLAGWGTYLYFTSEHWTHATFWGSLVADYISPFLSCLVAMITCSLEKRRFNRNAV